MIKICIHETTVRENDIFVCLFCFCCDFDMHHSEWLGYVNTDAHSIAAYDFSSLSSSLQFLVCCPTHREGAILHLRMLGAPYRVAK